MFQSKKSVTPQHTKIVKTGSNQYQEIEVNAVSEVKSIWNLIEVYLGRDDVSKTLRDVTESIFVRYITPAFGGPKMRGKRASAGAKEKAISFLSNKKIGLLEEAPDKLESYFEKRKIKKSQQSNIRSALKRIIQLAEEGNLFELAALEEEQGDAIKIFRHGRSPEIHNPSMRGKNSENLKLGSLDCHFVPADDALLGNTAEADKWKEGFVSSVLSARLHPNFCIANCAVAICEASPTLYLGNRELDRQLNQFAHFVEKRLRREPATIERDLDEVLRVLKWLHEDRGTPLENLNLHLIISDAPTPRSYKFKDFQAKYPDNLTQAQQEWALTRALAEERIEEAAQETERLMRDYLESKKIGYNSRANYLKTIINLGKYFYADQTKNFKRDRGFNDIEVITQLRQLQTEYGEQSLQKGELAQHKRSKRQKIAACSWEDVYMAPDLAFVKYEEEYKYMVTTTEAARRKDGSPRVRKGKRTDSARARDFQRALMLAMAVALPPGRSKVYYLMELGRTLVQGLWLNGNFVHCEDLPDEKKSEAQWRIDLTPADGKARTIDPEGWSCEIPDRQFSTGKTLYQYIEEWIGGERNYFKPRHNYLFTNERGKPMDSSAYGHKFCRAIQSLTGHSGIRPHLLRSILITYANERGMTDEQRRALAKLQRHSVETQEKDYNEIEEMKAMRPALEMMAEINDEIERKRSSQGKNYDIDE